CGLAALGLFLAAVGQARPDFMYFSEFGRGVIRRANLDGTEMTTLVRRLNGPIGPALDFAGGMIWAHSPGGAIRRANLDGTGQINLISGLNSPNTVVLDLAGGQMYWTSFFGGDIRRANLDGTGMMTLVRGLGAGLNTVALDIASSKMYYGVGETIGR